MIQEEITDQVKEVLEKNVWGTIQDFLDFEIFHLGSDEHPLVLTVGLLLFIVFILVVTSFLLKFLKRVLTRKLRKEDQLKFESVFSFLKYFVYIIVIFGALDGIGFNITAIFAASAALLVGIGLALQTFIQDILSGIFHLC